MGIRDLTPFDKKVQDMLKEDKFYQGLGIYKGMQERNGSLVHLFELEGEEKRYTALQVLEQISH